MKIDKGRLFYYDSGLYDEETARWNEDQPTLAAEGRERPPEMCSCQKHPSGKITSPRPTCMLCRGTGVPADNQEVHKYVFDGKGNFSEVNPSSSLPPEPDDGANLVKFR